MYIVRVIKGLGTAPDDGKGGGDVGGAARVRELHRVAVDRVAKQLCVNTRHPALNVELAHEARLHDELLEQPKMKPSAFQGLKTFHTYALRMRLLFGFV